MCSPHRPHPAQRSPAQGRIGFRACHTSPCARPRRDTFCPEEAKRLSGESWIEIPRPSSSHACRSRAEIPSEHASQVRAASESTGDLLNTPGGRRSTSPRSFADVRASNGPGLRVLFAAESEGGGWPPSSQDVASHTECMQPEWRDCNAAGFLVTSQISTGNF